jgi:hypothetical protein
VDRLSIVVVALDGAGPLEETLVSVLEHRPERSEVLVVLGQAYDDPYDLADEVRFVAAAPGASFAESANLGLLQSSGDVVCLLSAGAEVTRGWTRSAAVHFGDRHVSAVAPDLRHAADRQTPLRAVADYRPCGRLVLDSGATGKQRRPILSPTRLAGFYRRCAVLDVGGFDPAVGDPLVEVDLGLRLRAAGFTCLLEPDSRVFAMPARQGPGFLRGRAAESLFLRNRVLAPSPLPAHWLLMLAECLVPLPSRLAQLVGRLSAWAEWPRHRRHHELLRILSQRGQSHAGDAQRELQNPRRAAA